MPAALSTDYTDRKKDLLLFPISTQNGLVSAGELGMPKSFRFCTGTQKMLQRYLILLATGKGTQEAYPEFGTELFNNLVGRRMSGIDLVAEFAFANLDVISFMRQYQQENDIPLDEQISRATIESFSDQGDRVELVIRIESNAGQNYTYILPLPLKD